MSTNLGRKMVPLPWRREQIFVPFVEYISLVLPNHHNVSQGGEEGGSHHNAEGF